MLTSLIVGFAFGAIYDIFRIRRIASKKRKSKGKHLTSFIQAVIIGIEDVLFFILLGCVTSVLFYVFCHGRVRLLALLAELFGFVLYRLTVGRLVMLISNLIISFLYFVWRKFLTIVILPPIAFAKRMLTKAFEKMNAARKKAKRALYSARVKKKLLRASKKGMLGI